MDFDTDTEDQMVNSDNLESVQTQLPPSFRTTTRVGRNKSLKDLKAAPLLSTRTTFDPTNNSCPPLLQHAATMSTNDKSGSDLKHEMNERDFKHRKREIYSTNYGASCDLSHLYDDENENSNSGFYNYDHNSSNYNDDFGYSPNRKPRWQPYKPIEKCINFSCMDYNALTRYCQMFNLYNYNELKDSDFNFNNNEESHVDSQPNYKKLSKTELVEIVKNHILHTYSPVHRDERAIIGDFFTFIQRRREKIAKKLKISPVRSSKRRKNSDLKREREKESKDTQMETQRRKNRNKGKHSPNRNHNDSNSNNNSGSKNHHKRVDKKHESSNKNESSQKRNKSKNRNKSNKNRNKHHVSIKESNSKSSKNEKNGSSKNNGIIIDDSSDNDDIIMNARYNDHSSSRSHRKRSNDSESQRSSKHKSKKHKSKHKSKSKHKDKDKSSGHDSKKSKKDKHKKKKHRDKGKTKDKERKR